MKKGNNSSAASIPTLPGGPLKGGGKIFKGGTSFLISSALDYAISKMQPSKSRGILIMVKGEFEVYADVQAGAVAIMVGLAGAFDPDPVTKIFAISATYAAV